LVREGAQDSQSSNVFISYSAKDSSFVRLLHELLQSAGVNVYLDFELGAGGNFQRVLRDAINSSDAVIVVMSSAYFQSQWCQAELSLALEKEKRLLPILLDGEARGPLSYLNYIRVSEFSPEQLSTLVADAVRGSHGR
jgi:hypothetical protein